MTISRRSFFQAAGATAAGTLLMPYVSGIGYEAFAAGLAPHDRAALGNIRLNSNENPNGPGRACLDAIGASLDEANRYPHESIDALRAGIAASFGVRNENVVLGCGSSDVLRAAVYAFCAPGKALITSSPSYESPPSDARRIGAAVREIPVTGDLKLDLDAMATAARGAGLVYLCNPNNPTSTVHGVAAITRFVDRLSQESPQTTILIDEAYHEYVDDPSYATSLPIALKNPRVLIARTFSKVYGMAGMRVGYALGDAQTMRTLSPHVLSMSVNHPAASAALAGLNARGHVEQERVLNRAARAYTVNEISTLGFKVADTQSNFMMIDLRRNAQPFRDACKTRGVLVGRPFPPLDNYVRISVGTMPEMKAAMETFRHVLTTTYAKA